MALVFNFLFLFNYGFAQKQASSNSGIEQFKVAEDLSKQAQASLTAYAIQFSIKAANLYNHGDECQKSCPFGCCADSSGLIAEGGLFILYNKEATQYASSYGAGALNACNSSNQMSSSMRDCGATNKGYDSTLPDSNWYDSKGVCKSSAPDSCRAISSFPGGSIFGKKYLNCKQNGTCQEDFYSTYKQNSDGSINLKIGSQTHKLSLDSFKNSNSLMKIGLSKEVSESLVKQSQILKASLENKNSPASIPHSQTQTGSIEQDSITVKKEIENLSLTQSEKNVLKEKQNSLTVNYNGEPIHINTTDIFKSISDRYQSDIKTFIEFNQ